jgi:hypothetical protein
VTSAIVLIVVVVISYLYRQAKIKRHMLSQKARQQYDDIAASINYWAESKDNHERFQLARVALDSYDDWYKRSTVLPITMRDTTAEEFAVLTEWRNMIQDSEWKAKNACSCRPSDLLEIEYAVNRAALREHCSYVEPKF